MIDAILMQKIRDDVNTWESVPPATYLPYMYLDSEGLVTVGCGTMLPTAQAAGGLAFYHEKSLKPASSAEVEAEWTKLHQQGHAQKQKAPRDKFLAGHYAKSSDLRISRATADKLRDDHILSDYASLQLIYRSFEGFPEPAKLALFDMIYNLGAGRGATKHHRATGLRRYVLMNQAIGLGDWQLAAGRSSRRGIPPARNRMVHNLFMKSAALAPAGATAHVR